MANVNTTAFTNWMKTRYGNQIHDQENHDIKLLEFFTKHGTDHNYNGHTWVEAVKLDYMAGTGARAATAAVLPTPAVVTDLAATITPRNEYATVGFDGPTFARMDGPNDGSFLTAKATTMKWVERDFNKFRNQTLHGAGDGIRALINDSTPTGTTLVVDSPLGIAAPNDGWESNQAGKASRYLSAGRTIEFRDPGGAVQNTGDTNGTVISSIAHATQTLTVDDLPTNLSDDDEVFFDGEFDGTNTGVTGSYTIMGLAGIVDDGTLVGTFQNISRSTYDKWDATVDSNSGDLRPYDLQLLDEMATSIDEASGIDMGGDDYVLLGHRTVTSQVARDSLAANRGGIGNSKSGYSSGAQVAVGSGYMRCEHDVDCLPNRLYVLNKKKLDRWVAEPLNWDSNSGNVLQATGGADRTAEDTFRAYLRCQDNFGTMQPNAHGVITDIATM